MPAAGYRSPYRKPVGRHLLMIAAAAGLCWTVPATAQFGLGGIVYDPTNYAQNVLTAARTLEQINNQIRMLQNQATQLINEARNLENLPLSVLEPLQQQMRQTQQLLSRAKGIALNVQAIERDFGRTYRDVSLNASQRQLVMDAEKRWQATVSAFEDALKVQAGTVGNIEGSRQAIEVLVSASQSSTGALQAAQAGNQLLALQAQQISDLIASFAAMARAQSLDAASAATAKALAREQLRRFLGPARRNAAASPSFQKD